MVTSRNSRERNYRDQQHYAYFMEVDNGLAAQPGLYEIARRVSDS